MSPLLLGEYKVWIISQKVCIRKATPGPACAPMTAYTFTETWPPGYEEALLRNVSFPGNTVIEVGEQAADQEQDTDQEERGHLEPDPDTDTDKDVNTDNSNNENIHTVRETVPALLSTMDTIASNDDDDIEITDLQTVEAKDVEARCG